MYKKGQGTLSRIGVLIISVLVAIYGGRSWYYWPLLFRDATGFVDRVLSPGFIGGVFLFVGILAGGIYLVLFHPLTSDYLIDMGAELRKVVWPPVVPLFDPKTEAWGSTYVVIACTVILSIFIWLVDSALDFAITRQLLKLLVG